MKRISILWGLSILPTFIIYTMDTPCTKALILHYENTIQKTNDDIQKTKSIKRTYDKNKVQLSKNDGSSPDIITTQSQRTGYTLLNCKYSDGRTALDIAMEENRIEVVKALLNLTDIEVNGPRGWGYAPLHTAVMCGNEESIKILLTRKDIEVNGRGHLSYYDDATPLYMAIERNYEKIVNVFLADSRTEVNALVEGGYDSPLHCASERNFSSIINALLIRKDILVNMCDKNGDTPLHVACMDGVFCSVTALLASKDIDINIVNNDGETPLDVAKDYPEIVELLIKNGGLTAESLLSKQ